MDKKKIFGLVFINIIIVIGLIFLLNWVIYKYFYNALENNQNSPNENPYTIKRFVMDYNLLKKVFIRREPVGENYTKKPILIFGCSYGYGWPLEPNQELGYKLSQKTKRPVYNYSSPGCSPQFAIMQIRSHEIDDIIKRSEYVVYVLIGEHAWRIHTNSNGFNAEYIWPRYDIKNTKNGKELVFHKSYIPVIEGSYIYKYIQKVWFAKILLNTPLNFVQNYFVDGLKLYLLTIQKELKKINPSIKMIIISFHDREDTELVTSNIRFKELSNDDIIFLDMDKYLPQIHEEEYIVPNDGHPSEKAWDIISNLIVKELKLIN